METVVLLVPRDTVYKPDPALCGVIHDHYLLRPVVLSTWQHTQLGACPDKSTIIPESQVKFISIVYFFMPPDRMIGGILFLSCLFVCLSVVNFNLRYNFCTLRDRNFIFGMHTPLMTPFQMTPRSVDLVTLTLTLKLKIAFWTLLLLGAYCSVLQTHLNCLPWIETARASCFCPVCFFVCLTLCFSVLTKCLSVSNCNLHHRDER